MTDDELRAQFAGQALIAMQQLLTYERVVGAMEDPAKGKIIADAAWAIADAMLAARPAAQPAAAVDDDAA